MSTLTLHRTALFLSVTACTLLHRGDLGEAGAPACAAGCPLGLACVGGECSGTVCAEGRGDCDGVRENGCEADTRVELRHCGACARGCAAPRGQGRCVEGRCRVAGCEPGFADCDGVGENGCEAEPASSLAHCGACGRSCSHAHASSRCVEGSCRMGPCAEGYADCDGDATNGCEVELAVSPAHCGACGHPCPAPPGGTAMCVAGACAPRCDPGREVMSRACVAPGAPRLIAPVSAAEVGTRPTLRWARPSRGGAVRVELCRDRAMRRDCQAHTVDGVALTPPSDLARGPWFWRAAGTRDPPGQSPIWAFITRPRMGDRVRVGPRDLHGDGVDDLVVGAYSAAAALSANRSGAVYAYAGAAGRPPTPQRVWTGSFPEEAFGRGLSLGDLTGDGIAELLIAADLPAGGATPFRGAVSVFLGAPTGPTAAPQRTILPRHHAFGASLAVVGDLDGDGFGDAVLASSSAPSGPIAALLSVHRGGPEGPAPDPWQVVRVAGPAREVIVAPGGDLDGDGFADVIVATPHDDDGARRRVGAVRVLRGGPTGLTDAPAAALRGGAPDELLGWALANVGDLDGDGHDEVALGAPGAGGGVGAVRVLRGSVDGPRLERVVELPGPAAGLRFGTSVAAIGDVNGDGRSDFAVGAPAEGVEPGRVFVFHGAQGDVPTVAAVTLRGDSARAAFGGAVTGLGDLDGDGYDDIAVGEYAADAARGDSGAGRVLLYRGSPAGLVPTPFATLEPMVRGGYFGRRLARVGARMSRGDG